jgi:glutamate/tyrosine decarboxylase-like PLP-dependent enzyme
MSAPDLTAMIRDDARAGHRGFCVVATAGTTSTGAVDPLDEIATICAEHELWFHVDGAFGAAAVLTDTDLLAGLDRADSIALDPHKWWFQPYEAGCVLVRDITSLSDAFALNAEYLRETRDESVPLNFYDLGPQLTRSFRALKVWMSMKTFGIDAFRSAVEHGIALVEHAHQVLRDDSRWQVVTPAQLAVITFRPHSPGRTDDEVDALTRRIAAATLHDGDAVITTTELDGRPVLRLCALHPEATTADIDAVIELLGRNRDLA